MSAWEVRLGFALLLGAAPAVAQGSVDSGIVTTRHRITVNGRAIAYTARAGLLPIRINATGEPHAYVFFVAYTVDRPRGAPPRPLTMLWNGGPGANSELVHLVAFGPRRIVAKDPAHPDRLSIEANELTWLDATDLVFVDPVGTGYGRLATAEYAPEFFSTLGDIASIAEFARVYLTRFDAWKSPLFVGGESFGVWRAAGVAETLERHGIRVAGEILISGGIPVLAVVPYEMKAALFLPTRTTSALYHHRLNPEMQRDPAATIATVTAWARTEYARALDDPDALTPAQRADVVAQLSRFTGLDQSLIDRQTLIVKRGQFAEQLLKDQGLVLARFDTRQTRPAHAPPRLSPWDAQRDALTVQYLHLELRYRTDLAYQGSEEGYVPVNAKESLAPDERWEYDQNPPPPKDSTAPPSAASKARRLADDGPPNGAEPWLRRAMEIDPSLHALVAVGMYDSLNSCAWNDYLVTLLEPAVRGNITAKCYVGGHMMYEDPDTRRALKRDVAAFIRANSRMMNAGDR